jgi:hypothetical protein
LARDLFLMQNVFPEPVARLAAERRITFPDDSVPHVSGSGDTRTTA